MSAAGGWLVGMTGPTTGPTTLTARTPEDLLAVVRVVLGFEPADSIVMLTLGARHPCHARVDLPDTRATWQRSPTCC